MAVLTLLSGSYTDGTPDGINVLSFDTDTGELAHVRALPGAPDASYFAFDPATRRLYVTDEMGPRVGAFALDAGATALTPLGYQPAEADYPCYVALSPDRRRLAVADYGSDVVAIFDLDTASSALRPGPKLLRGTGNAAPGHAHWVQWSPEGDRLYVVDLGHDEVRVHDVDADGSIGPGRTAFRMPTKSGPRHLAFHPGGQLAFLLTEYANTLTALRRQPDGTLRQIQTISTLPAGYAETSYGAHVQLSADGSAVYVSNRGHNSIAVLAIAGDGRLTARQTVPCGGDWPRFFLLLDRHLIVANQKSDNLAVFAVAPDGMLRPTGHGLSLNRPVMLLRLPD